MLASNRPVLRLDESDKPKICNILQFFIELYRKYPTPAPGSFTSDLVSIASTIGWHQKVNKNFAALLAHASLPSLALAIFQEHATTTTTIDGLNFLLVTPTIFYVSVVC